MTDRPDTDNLKTTGKLRLRETSIRIKAKPGLGPVSRKRLRAAIITHWRLMQLAERTGT